MGSAQRRKGASGERSLVMHLRLLGYDARRVIRTRAVSGYENDVVPDVIATRPGDPLELTFENKCSKDAYKSIYDLYNKERIVGLSVCRLSIEGKLVAIGTDLEEVRKHRDVYFTRREPVGGREVKTFRRLLNLKKLLKGAMFLVVKNNNQAPLFLRYWL